MATSKRHWLRVLRESLGEHESASIIVATPDGARHVEIHKSEIDDYLAHHLGQLRWRKRLLISLLGVCLISLAVYLTNLFMINARYEARTQEYRSLTAALDDLLETAEVGTALPLERSGSERLEDSVQELTRLLTQTDLAFKIYVETTRDILGERKQALTRGLADAGLGDLDLAEVVARKTNPSGGLLMDEGLTSILDLYLDESIYTLLDEHTALSSLQDMLPNTRPLANGRVTSRFGMRRHPVTGRYTAHQGVDLVSYDDRTVYAAGPGQVVFAGRDGGLGNVVIIDHGMGLESVYAHLANFSVKTGDWLERSQPLGTMGRTGLTTGLHLHYEVRFNGQYLDPLKIFKVAANVR